MAEKKNFACFGDSITSDEVSGIGTTTAGVLGMNLIGNFAHGNATCSDWYNSDKRLTAVNFDIVPNQWHPDNVLSNQVLKVLRDMTPTGKPVCWTHPECGEFSVNACGTGSIKSKPDVIYIAIGANDGKEEQGNATPIFDNCDEVFRQKYSELTKKGIASALRWAIETLKCSFEDCFIFVASPLQAARNLAAPDTLNFILLVAVGHGLPSLSTTDTVTNERSSPFDDMLLRSAFSTIRAGAPAVRIIFSPLGVPS